MKKTIKEEVNVEDSNKSFFQRLRTDKKFSAKVQLIGYGIFIVVLILYVNVSNVGSSNINSTLGNNISNTVTDSGEKNTDEVSDNLLEVVDDNYQYELVVDVKKKNSDTNGEEELEIKYRGKSYGDKLEITKEDNSGSKLYYKVDDLYYSKIEENFELVDDNTIYDIVDSKYLELENVLKLIDKASLDHVTDYSSGKKEYVYHLKVKDVVLSYQMDDVVEIEVEEENGVLKIEVDYSVLLKVIDDTILECEVDYTITEIDKIKDFEVLVEKEENTSEEQ